MDNTKLYQAIDMMIRTDHMHRMLIDSRVREIGIHRTQHRILMHLARHDKLPSQKELAEHLDVTPAAVTGALKKIESDGYIEKKLGQDNRYYEIQITEKGRELVKLTRKLFSEVDSSMFEGFSEDELNAYISCLKKLQGNMKKQIGCQCSPHVQRKENDE